MLEINLDELRKGLPGFTSIASSYLAEAATYCLNISGHKTGVNLTLEVGDEKNTSGKTVALQKHTCLYRCYRI